jgi:hypothetical protein
METNENTNIEQLKLRLIEQILAIENIETLQEMLQFFVSQKTIAEKEIADEDNKILEEKPFVVIRKYDKNTPYPKNDIPENEMMFKGLRNKPTKMYQNIEDLPNYDENLLNEEQSLGLAKTLQSIGNLFDDEPPLEELLKDLTA